MLADIITIGDEILIGQVIDSNSAYIAEQLTSTGFTVRQIRSISDKESDIINALDDVIQNTDLVIITGGLGPTNDDITKKTLAKYFDSRLVIDKEVLDHVISLLTSRGINPGEINRKQAEIPHNCQILFNHHGTAPGMLFKKDNKVIVSLPGVPFEMKSLIDDQLLPYLIENFIFPAKVQKTFLTSGVPESVMAERLAAFESALPENARLAYLPSPGVLRLRLSISGNNKDYINREFKKLESNLIALLGEDLFGFDKDTIEGVIGDLLKNLNMSLSTAESCTGGAIAKRITSISGASVYFKGSVVAYDNSIKVKVLDVNAEALERFGAVSEQVVLQMASGISELMNTDFSVATSGIAGPAGGSIEKPVGTTWIAVKSPLGSKASKFQFGEHRGRNILRASITALNLLRKEIMNVVEKSNKKV